MSYDLMLQQAVSLHNQGYLDDAEKLYRQILEAIPNQPDVLNLLGLVAQAKGIDNEAVALFYQAIRQAPQKASFYFNLAFSLKSLEKYAESLENFDKALALSPLLKEAFLQKGLVFLSLQNKEEARQNFEQALALDENYIEAKVRLAATFDDDKALPLLLENSDDALSLYYTALIYMRKNDRKQAKVCAEKANLLAPQVDEVKVLLGEIAVLEGNDDDAEIWFKKAYMLNGYNQAALIGLANLYARKKMPDEAEKLYQRLLEINPTNLDAHIGYAALLHNQRRLAEALEEYRRAVIINPDVPEISYNLALVLKDVKEYDEALGLLFNALAKQSFRHEISAAVAEILTILYREGRQEDAIKLADNWVKTYPEDSFAGHVLAALKGEKIENNPVYVQNLFELFADNYELVMSNLAYSVPQAFRRIIGDVEGTIVDLGCGSGLAGQALKTSRNKIIGVDISPAMLAKAKEKNIYTNLICADIIDYLKTKPAADYFIAADVFNYFYNLKELIKLLKNNKIVFSIEVSVQEEISLSDSGRYQHNPAYIKQILEENSFNHVKSENVILRQENGKDVKGMIFFAY